MKVGLAGICIADSPSEITALMHDLQATEQPAAMVTFEKVEGAAFAPVRIWKRGKSTLRGMWMTQLGSGENGQVQYIGALQPEEDETWEEELSTEVLVLRVHQAWVSKATWAMWKPNADRLEVARAWLRRQGLEEFVEPGGMFHPLMYGVEPAATATISVRVDRH